MRERRASVTLAPVQDENRVLDHHTVGDLHERAAGEERVVQHRERIRRRSRSRADQLAHVGAVAGRDAAHAHTLRFERGIDLVMDDTPVAHDEHRGVRAGLGRPRTATGCSLVAGTPELGLVERPVPREIELTDPAVAPDLLFGSRPRDPGQRLGGRDAPVDEPVRPAQRTRSIDGESVSHRA